MRLPQRDHPASVHLDTLRAVAALLVMVGHVRNLFVKSAATTGHLSVAQRLFYLLTKQGASAVIVFFVLSGFLVGTSVVSQFERGTWNWGRYALARLSRLWVVLVPALILTYLFDSAGLALFPKSAVYSTPHYASMMPQVLGAGLTLPVFLGNIGFLQTIDVPTFGSNGALWSLANEFWYYVLFPALVLLLWRGIHLAARVVGLAVGLSVLILLPSGIRDLFVVWLMGAALAFVPPLRVPLGVRWLTGGVLVVFLAVGSAKPIPFSAHILGLVTVAFVYCLLNASGPAPTRRAVVSAFGSEMSYSLYLAHTPFVVFLAALALHGSQLEPDVRGMLAVLGVSCVAVVYAALVWWLFERRTEAIRRWIALRLPLSKTAVSPGSAS